MARQELISVNFFDSLCSKRFRTFFFLCSETKRKRLQGRLNFGHMSISCFSKSDRVMRLNKSHAAKLCKEKLCFSRRTVFLFSNGSADCVSMGNEQPECGSLHLPRISYIGIT